MLIRAFLEEMERLAPSFLADDSDRERIGLIVEGRPEITKVCCALDPTPGVVARAVAVSADMLVVHHTPLWTPVTKLTGRTGQILRAILAADMNLYVMHTNFDRADNGVNDVLARLLLLTDVSSLSLGRIGTCHITLSEISRTLGGGIRTWGALGETVTRLAVVAGSGFDPGLLQEAVDRGADAFLSSEMKHAVARAAPLPCIEATHYALEAPGMRELASRMGWEYIDDPPVVRQFP
ncbi:MAG: Nif3-like dinuclear metal center hexameric protein [Methanoregula sp.]|nr:Nif3-like dinuclear metal center hexameric protein [Methanoregula sp.]